MKGLIIQTKKKQTEVNEDTRSTINPPRNMKEFIKTTKKIMINMKNVLRITRKTMKGKKNRRINIKSSMRNILDLISPIDHKIGINPKRNFMIEILNRNLMRKANLNIQSTTIREKN